MAKDVYTYLKSTDGILYYSNQRDGKYKPVRAETITASGGTGDRIIWQCVEGISSLNAVVKSDKPNNPNVFTKEGITKTNEQCWSGILKKGEGKTALEKYDISWMDSEGREHSMDPCVGNHW